ncbi:DUF5134 domain-containing protein [Kitasatospora sp. NBC_00070]|uniref:DUF5134 domain-containing protein n=1 Tax=Kitasatospora sp. NBC_00070 TaxID=2975962 RepID=UPI0032481C56
MHGPVLVSWLLAALAVASSAFGLYRLRVGLGDCDPAGQGSDAAEALMGLGMAGMVLRPGIVWGWLFALLALALLLGALAPGAPRAHRLHHGVGALAMTYMGLAPAGHHGSMGPPAVTGALLVYFGGYALWTGSRLLSVPDGPVGPVGVGRIAVGPAAVSRACRTAMGVGMFAMLLTM